MPSFTPPARWPAALTERWKVEVGTGYASPLVIGDRVFVFARQHDDEVVIAVDAATGKPIWEGRYAAPYQLVRAAASHGDGPKGTPAFGDGRLFTWASAAFCPPGVQRLVSASGNTQHRRSDRCTARPNPLFTTAAA